MNATTKLLTELNERMKRIEAATAEVMNCDEAARFLRISKSTLDKLSRPGNMVIPVSVFGGKKKLFLKRDLLRFIEENKTRRIAA